MRRTTASEPGGRVSRPVPFSRRLHVSLSLWWFLSSALLIGVYAALSLFYAPLFVPRSPATDNLWFGADVSRYTRYAEEPTYWFRSELHPFAFLLFHGYGHLLRCWAGAPITHGNVPLLVAALPALVLSAFAISTSALVLSSPGRGHGADGAVDRARIPPRLYAVGVVASLVVGSTLVFAPVPESHTLGGAALLLQATLVMATLRAARERQATGGRGEEEEEAAPAGVRRRAVCALLCGALATGFTLSNAVAAMLLLLPLGRLPSLGPLILRGAALSMAAISVLVVLLLRVTLPQKPVSAGVTDWLAAEMRWSSLPSVATVGTSFRGLVVAQFGTPIAKTITESGPDGFSQPARRLVLTKRVPPLQIVALVLWTVGIVQWARRNRSAALADRDSEQQVALACAGALLFLVGFHAIYDASEAFLFSGHAWPFVLLPGLFALEESLYERRTGVMLCLLSAIAVSAVQVVLGFTALSPLLHKG